ncbi:hypothetical protein ACLBVF_34650, partial [Pseudomonas aeruginosa]|uniref:hypothetical protein n=1 Tax=Pseudomonas aeruginosa TaxID=287 RepID=UPI003967F36C
MQLTRLVQVDCPLGPDVLLLQRMEGREELGRLFAYELHLVSENPNLPLEQLLGIAQLIHDLSEGRAA